MRARLASSAPRRHRRGGGFIIVLFQLADGSVKAIGAGTVGISREVTTRDHGPLSG